MATTITPRIVNVNAVVTRAPTPSQYQQSGALVSVGGTTLSTGTYQYCGTLSEVQAILQSSGTGNYTELSNMATTFFAQGNSVGVYVLELGGESTPAAGITALQTWITANPGVFYAYLTPAVWDTAAANLNTLAGDYSSPSGQTYFFATTSVSTISGYTTNKALVLTVPSPTAASTEFQAAFPFYQWLVNNPGPANQLAPMAFRYGYGVTPWAQTGNAANIDAVLTDYGNLVLTGAEGGISTACLFKGTTMDGEQAAWWYGIDWFQIQVKQALAAAVINGSNSNPPLLYNQAGINSLQKVAQNVANSAVAFGCALSAVVTAVPFTTYTTENPSDYNAGIYNGLAATVVGPSGFLTITFNLDAVQFVA